jgi:hypothetical protein
MLPVIFEKHGFEETVKENKKLNISNIVKFNPKDIFNMTTELVSALTQKSVVETKYAYKIPKTLKITDRGNIEKSSF